MTDPKKKSYENQAATIIKNLAKRKMQGFYCEDVEAAKKKLLELLADCTTVGYGGSMTLDQN